MAQTKQQSHIRRDQIAQAALDLVSVGGLRSVSMAAVARRVGIVPSAIYRHFSNKDEVLDAIIDYIGERMKANVEQSLAQSADPMNQLHALLMRHTALIRTNRGIPRIVFSEALHHGHPKRRRKIHSMVTGYLAAVARLFQEAQAAGQINRTTRPDTLAVMFLGLIQTPAILWHLSDGKYDVTRQAERAWAAFQVGLTPAAKVRKKTRG